MKNVHRIKFICIAVLIGYTFLTSIASIAAEPLKIGILKTLSGLPLYVALDEELFLQAGFEVEVTSYQTSDLVFEALKQGQIDLVGVAGLSQALKVAERQPEFLWLLGILYSSSCLIVAESEEEILHTRQLSGKTIGVYPGSIFGTYAREALKKSGTSLEQVKFSPMPPSLQLDALAAGKVDAIYTLEPVCAMGVQNHIGKYLTREDLFAKHFLQGQKFPGGAVAISRQFAQHFPGTPKKIIEVFEKALYIIKEQHFDMTPYLRRYTRISKKFLPHLNYEGAAFGKDIPLNSLEQLVSKLNEWNLLHDQVPVRELVWHSHSNDKN